MGLVAKLEVSKDFKPYPPLPAKTLKRAQKRALISDFVSPSLKGVVRASTGLGSS